MIFGRKKKARADEDEVVAEDSTAQAADGSAADEADVSDETAADPATDEDGGDDTSADPDEDATPGLDTEALDATEWRTDGPFEVGELDGTDPDDDAPRIDLGSLVIAPVPGSELRLQVNEAQDIVSAMLVLPVHAPGTDGDTPEVVASSALELSAYAAPRSGGLWAELRDEISEAAVEVGGSAELAAGPFGVELRRLLPVTTPTGEQGYQPSRMWVAEGQRWLLRGIVYGQAAITDDDEDPAVAAVLAAFRDVVVRRGDEAMAPGDLLPMTIPADLQPAD
ncbi:Protein of unknown function [Microlunatus sagamiharensis]|uniref:DUF3710 domain-containing protein n=1 Tax=Microlunatus sagamiharensis TaxID=546874 RepID=A0A1H2M0X7_9ACTN|nr:DUF3710 domain-containing protein [Microlunatus sagamiharensis]SDU86762.1 Protein of unknown function [Microlunatus sagamiharensis]